MVRGEPAGDEARILQVGDADREIETLPDDVDKGIGEHEVDATAGYRSRNRPSAGATCIRPKEVGAETRRMPRAVSLPRATQASASSTLERIETTRS